MPREIVLDQIHIEGPKESCCFDFKYVRMGNRAILEKAVERATRGFSEESARVFRVKTQTIAGYLGAARHNEPWPTKEIYRQELSWEELKNLFG